MNDLKLALVINAIDKSPSVFRGIEQNAKRTINSVSQSIGKLSSIGGAVTRGAAALGIGVGIAETARAVVEANEALEQFRYSAGLTEKQFEDLNRTIYDTAVAGRVSSDELSTATRAAVQFGAPIGEAAENARVLATQLALGRGQADELGPLLGRFAKNGFTGEIGKRKAFALLNEEIRGSGLSFGDITPSIGGMLASYEQSGHGGIEGLRDVGATLGVIGDTGGRRKQTLSDVTSLLGILHDRESAHAFGASGIQAWDEANNRSISLPDLITKIGEKMQQPGGDEALKHGGLDIAVSQGLASVYNDFKTKGRASGLEARLAMRGDAAADEAGARDIGRGLPGAWNATFGRLKQVFDAGIRQLKPISGAIGDHPNYAAGALGLMGVSGLMGGFSGAAGSTGILSGAIGILRGALTGILNPFGLVTGAAALLRSGISGLALRVAVGLSGAFPVAAEAVLGFGAVIAGLPLAVIVGGVAALAASAYFIYRNWGGIKDWWHELWGGIGTDVETAHARIGAADTRAAAKHAGVWSYTKDAARWITGKETDARSKEALSYFQSQGWTPEQSAGIVANLQRESRMDDTRPGDHGHAFGLAQWHGDRANALAAHFGKPLDKMGFEGQLAAVNYELRDGAEQSAGGVIGTARTAREAAEAASRLYERPANGAGEASTRGGMAEALMRQMQPAEAQKAQIAIQIDGLPQGAKAKIKSENADVDFGLGYHMAPAQ